MTTITTSTQRTTVTTPEVAQDPSQPSIRQIIMGGILAKQDKAAIKAKVDELYPTSAASAKFGKHYAWYKATMKKAGQLPPVE